jgi:hypothetical protein
MTIAGKLIRLRDGYNLIGIVAEYVPFEDHGNNFLLANNSGYSIATPMDFVVELIEAMQAPERSGGG